MLDDAGNRADRRRQAAGSAIGPNRQSRMGCPRRSRSRLRGTGRHRRAPRARGRRRPRRTGSPRRAPAPARRAVRDRFDASADDHEAVGGRGHDLLAQQRPAQALHEAAAGRISSAPSMATSVAAARRASSAAPRLAAPALAVVSEVGTPRRPAARPRPAAGRSRSTTRRRGRARAEPDRHAARHLGRDGGLRGRPLGVVSTVMPGTAAANWWAVRGDGAGAGAAVAQRRVLGALGHAPSRARAPAAAAISRYAFLARQVEPHAPPEPVGERHLLAARPRPRRSSSARSECVMCRHVEAVGASPRRSTLRGRADDPALERGAQRPVGARRRRRTRGRRGTAGTTGPSPADGLEHRVACARRSPCATWISRRPRSANAAAQARTVADLPVPGGP